MRGGHYSGQIERPNDPNWIPFRAYGYRITGKDLPRLYAEGRRTIHPILDEQGYADCVTNYGSRFCVCGSYEYNWDTTLLGWINDRVDEIRERNTKPQPGAFVPYEPAPLWYEFWK